MIGVNHLNVDPILVSDKKQSNHKLWQVCNSRITERQKGSFSLSASTIYMGSGLVSLLLFLIGFDVPYKIQLPSDQVGLLVILNWNLKYQVRMHDISIIASGPARYLAHWMYSSQASFHNQTKLLGSW